MPEPYYGLLTADLETIEFWAQIQSEHPQILLSVLPHLQERYARELRRFQREFANIASAAENLRLRLEQFPETVPAEVAGEILALVQSAQTANQEFLTLLRDLTTVYPETDLASLIQHMMLETRRSEEELERIELSLPPQNQPPPTPTLADFLEDLEFWARDMREHATTLRAFLPNVTYEDRNTLSRFERDYRSLELAVRRLREALATPGQYQEAIVAEARRLAMLTRNLTLEFMRFQEDLLSRYLDATSRFLIRHMLQEGRRLIEELRTSGFLFLGS